MAAKCPKCGAPMENDRCDYCGYVVKEVTKPASTAQDASQQPVQPQIRQPEAVTPTPPIHNVHAIPSVSRKSKVKALLLCVFFGGIGAHRFYVGKVGTGILYLFTMGLFGIGWFIDFILIAIGSFKDEFSLPLRL